MNHGNDGPDKDGELLPAIPEDDPESEQTPQAEQGVTVRDIVDLEHTRIDQENRRSEVFAKALEYEDIQDERHFTGAEIQTGVVSLVQCRVGATGRSPLRRPGCTRRPACLVTPPTNPTCGYRNGYVRHWTSDKTLAHYPGPTPR